MKRATHIHGGASSDPDHKDGTVKAARIAIECLRDGKIVLGAVLIRILNKTFINIKSFFKDEVQKLINRGFIETNH